MKRLDAVKWDMLKKWSKPKRAPKSADRMRKRQIAGAKA